MAAWGFWHLCLCFRMDFELGFGLSFCFSMGFGVISSWVLGFVCISGLCSGMGFDLSLHFGLVVLDLLVSIWIAHIYALFLVFLI